MEWWVWLLIGVGVVFGALGGAFELPQPKARSRKQPVPMQSSASSIHDERAAKIIDESIQIAKTTKSRATAEKRLKLAEQLLDELLAKRSTWVDEKITRGRIDLIRSTFEARFARKTGKRAL